MNHTPPPAFNGDLASLLWPVSVETFFRDYWQTQPLHVSHADTCFAGLYSLDDIDDLVRFTAPIDAGSDKVRMGIKGLAVPDLELRGREAPGFNYELIRAGSQAVSLVLNHIHEDNRCVAVLARRLQRDFAGRLKTSVNVNAYLTPGHSWLGLHRDTHDEINLQVLGAKTWRIYESDVPLPIPEMPVPAAPPRPLGPPCLEFDVRQGDVLYMPRGFWHDPVNLEDGPSLGLTVGLTAMVWSDVLVGSIRLAAAAHEPLRRGVPPEAGSDMALPPTSRELFERAQPWAAAASAVDAIQRGLDAGLPAWTACGDTPAGLRPDSHLRRSPSSTWQFHVVCGMIRLEVDGRRLGLRLELREALEAMRTREDFTPSQLPGALPEEERLGCCRLLMRFGAIQMVE